MLAKTHRLQRPEDFRKVYRKGKRSGAPLATLFSLCEGSDVRVGFVVSTKVSKRTVERNRIKRILREEVRKRLKTLPKGSYIILVKVKAAKQSSLALRETINKLFADTKEIA